MVMVDRVREGGYWEEQKIMEHKYKERKMGDKGAEYMGEGLGDIRMGTGEGQIYEDREWGTNYIRTGARLLWESGQRYINYKEEREVSKIIRVPLDHPPPSIYHPLAGFSFLVFSLSISTYPP